MGNFKWLLVIVTIVLIAIGVAGITRAQSIHSLESTNTPVSEEPLAFEVANCLASDTPLMGILASYTFTQTASGLDVVRSCPACGIPSDPRTCCIQYADHYSPCATDGCGADQQRWHRCWRYCYPNQQSCGGWNSIDMGCVYSDCNLRDSCQSCSGYCPVKSTP